MQRVLTVPAEEDGTRLDRFLRRQIDGLKQVQIEKLLRAGKIRVDGAKAKSNFRIAGGMEISVPEFLFTPGTGQSADNDKPRKSASETMDASVAQKILQDMTLSSTEAWMALDKPAGLAVQGGSGTNRHIDGLLMAAFPDNRPKLVHRIDKDTSGLLLVARGLEAARHLTKAFEIGTIQKSYLAVVIGDPGPAGLIDAPLAKSGGQGNQKMMVDKYDGQSAQSLYHRLALIGDYALVALRPLTGRTHQLRVHMASHGTPILGDGKYAGAYAHPSSQFARQLHLHAQFLTLPDGHSLAAPLPRHMAEAMSILGCGADVPSHMPLFKEAKQSRRGR